MRVIKNVPPPLPPPPATYTLNLSFGELVTLGVLSFRHEAGGTYGSFYESLPREIRDAAEQPLCSPAGFSRFDRDWSA